MRELQSVYRCRLLPVLPFPAPAAARCSSVGYLHRRIYETFAVREWLRTGWLSWPNVFELGYRLQVRACTIGMVSLHLAVL